MFKKRYNDDNDSVIFSSFQQRDSEISPYVLSEIAHTICGIIMII